MSNEQNGFMRVCGNIYRYFKKKDDEEIAKKPVLGYRGRQMIILLCIIAFSVFVGFHLLKFTVLDGDKWKMLANDQQTGSLTIKASRGTIYDTNGTVLAQSSTVWDVVIDPKAIDEANTDRKESYEKRKKAYDSGEGENPGAFVELSELIAEKLEDVLGADGDDIRDVCKNINTQYYIVKRKVEKPEVTEITQFLLDNSIPSNCIYTEESSKRYYPGGTLASTVIGFTNYDGEGVYGLEAYYDDYLKGTDGKAFYTMNGMGEGIEYANDSYFSAVDGYSLQLTLDEVMQHYVEKELAECVSQHKVINRATAIIMNCKTGGIIAMATSPAFDLNSPSELVDSYSIEQLNALKASGASEEELDAAEATYREQQWKNKAVTELYYPGSVFKTITCAAALDQEVINMDSTFSCPGYWEVAGETIHCWSTGGHGTLNLQEAITASCNPAFIQIGEKLGADKFSDYFEAFGFTEPTGIDLPGEAQSLYVSRNNMGPVELAVSSFGYTNKITPIQMCAAFSAVVNGGNLVTPHLVDKILDSNGNVVETYETDVKRQVISEETSEQMREILETIVTQNGGHNAYIAGYRIGGKSGTAEKLDEYNAGGQEKMTYISTFAAAVPMDDPQIVMLVVADTPTGPEYYGSAVTCPVVSAVFSEGLEHLGIYPTYTAEEQAKMDATVPYVVGNLSMYAESVLTAQNFKARFVGSTENEARVTAQIPLSGTSIPRGSTVVLYFGDAELETGTVPNVIGMTVDQANEAITNAGFNIKISGGAAGNANAVATEQSMAEGVVTYKGSVVEVTFMVSGRAD